jgi:hypothetical protein
MRRVSAASNATGGAARKYLTNQQRIRSFAEEVAALNPDRTGPYEDGTSQHVGRQLDMQGGDGDKQSLGLDTQYHTANPVASNNI